MKAARYTDYGPPEVVQLVEVDKPVPGPTEIVVKVAATTVTQVDAIFRSGAHMAARLFTGLFKTKFNILGSEFVGVVESVGTGVTRFKAGDKVMGGSENFGAHADYQLIGENDLLIPAPEGLSAVDTVAAMHGAITATHFLTDGAKAGPGKTILVNGASGAIGVIAVQLAKEMGASVVGVCSSANVELVKSLGADEVIDYTVEDFTKRREAYDCVFDTVGKASFFKCRKALKPGGLYLTTFAGLSILPMMVASLLFPSKKGRPMFAGMQKVEEKVEDMNYLYRLMGEGKIRAVIDQTFSLDQIVEAHRLVDTHHKKGSVVITVGGES